MKSTAKTLGTVDFIAGYIVDDIMNKIANKVFFNESAKNYIYTFPQKYQENNEIVKTVFTTLNIYGYEVAFSKILSKESVNEYLLELEISW